MGEKYQNSSKSLNFMTQFGIQLGVVCTRQFTLEEERCHRGQKSGLGVLRTGFKSSFDTSQPHDPREPCTTRSYAPVVDLHEDQREFPHEEVPTLISGLYPLKLFTFIVDHHISSYSLRTFQEKGIKASQASSLCRLF